MSATRVSLKQMEKMIWEALGDILGNIEQYDTYFNDSMIVGYAAPAIVVSGKQGEEVMVKTSPSERLRYDTALEEVMGKIEEMAEGAFNIEDWIELNEPRNPKFISADAITPSQIASTDKARLSDNVRTVYSREKARKEVEWD